MSNSTYLSPGVRHLLLSPSGPETNDDFRQLNSVSIEEIRRCLTPNDDEKSVFQLNEKVLPQIEKMFEKTSDDDFRKFYGEEKFSRWLTDPNELFRIFRFLKQNEIHLATLLLTAFVERNLGNLLLLRTNSVPDLLRQIVESNFLREIIGDDLVVAFQFLIGTPKSINLRNIFWHGFVQNNEISPKWTFLLLYLFLQIGPIVGEKKIPRRNFWSLEKFANHPIFPQQFFLDKNFIRNSRLIDDGFRPLFFSSLDFFFTGQFALSLVLLLPLYEHLLRKLFVEANRCPERLLTAEATTLFTTLDEITECCLPSGNKNQLCRELGSGYLGLLGDLTTFPEGIRLRSKLSHGEIDLQNLPETIGQVQLALVFVLFYRYDKNFEMVDERAKSLLNFVENYQIGFHPIAIAKTQMRRWMKTFDDLPSLSPYIDENEVTKIDVFNLPIDLKPLTKLLTPSSSLILSSNISLSIIRKLIDDENQNLINRYCSCQLNTSGYNEQSLLILIRQISVHLNNICTNLSNFIRIRGQAYQSKQLRANQRNNFERFSASYEGFCQSIIFIGFVNACFLFSLDRIRTLDLANSSNMIKFLRLWLTFVENTVNLSDLTSNRWDEILLRYSNSLEKSKKIFDKF